MEYQDEGRNRSQNISSLSSKLIDVERKTRQIEMELKDDIQMLNAGGLRSAREMRQLKDKVLIDKETASILNRSIKTAGIALGALATGVKKSSAFMGEYADSLQEFSVNKRNMSQMLLGAVGGMPIGYFASKIFETQTMQNLMYNMKSKSGELISRALRFGKKKKDVGAAYEDFDEDIPKMARGGYVKKGGLIQAHSAEVVMPIEKLIEELRKQEKARVPSRTMINMAKDTRVIKINTKVTADYTKKMALSEGRSTARIVKALEELKVTMVGTTDQWRIHMQTMLLRNPLIKKVMTLYEMFGAFIINPLTKLFGVRGGYAGRARGAMDTDNVFMKSANLLSLIYTDLMPKMDQLININIAIAKRLWAGRYAEKGSLKAAKEPETYTMAGKIRDYMTGKTKRKTLFERLVDQIESDEKTLAEFGITKVGDFFNVFKILANMGITKENIIDRKKSFFDRASSNIQEATGKNVSFVKIFESRPEKVFKLREKRKFTNVMVDAVKELKHIRVKSGQNVEATASIGKELKKSKGMFELIKDGIFMFGSAIGSLASTVTGAISGVYGTIKDLVIGTALYKFAKGKLGGVGAFSKIGDFFKTGKGSNIAKGAGSVLGGAAGWGKGLLGKMGGAAGTAKTASNVIPFPGTAPLGSIDALKGAGGAAAKGGTLIKELSLLQALKQPGMMGKGAGLWKWLATGSAKLPVVGALLGGALNTLGVDPGKKLGAFVGGATSFSEKGIQKDMDAWDVGKLGAAVFAQSATGALLGGKLGAAIGSVVPVAGTLMGGAIGTVAGAILGGAAALIGQERIAEATNTLSDKASKALDTLITEVYEPLKQKVEDTIYSIGTSIGSIYDSIAEVTSEWSSKAGDYISEIMTPFTDMVSGWWDSAKSIPIIGSLLGGIEDIYKANTELLEKAQTYKPEPGSIEESISSILGFINPAEWYRKIASKKEGLELQKRIGNTWYDPKQIEEKKIFTPTAREKKWGISLQSSEGRQPTAVERSYARSPDAAKLNETMRGEKAREAETMKKMGDGMITPLKDELANTNKTIKTSNAALSNTIVSSTNVITNSSNVNSRNGGGGSRGGFNSGINDTSQVLMANLG